MPQCRLFLTLALAVAAWAAQPSTPSVHQIGQQLEGLRSGRQLTENGGADTTPYLPDRYKPIVQIISHEGSCQSSCLEERTVHVEPDIPYFARIEVIQADMRSLSERVEVELGANSTSALRSCSPRDPSDFACGWWLCSEWYFGVAGAPKLDVKVWGRQTRDICKCHIDALNQDADCYSALLSGLDPTFGMLTRLTLIPAVDAVWRSSAWEPCQQGDCSSLTATSSRTMSCQAEPMGAAALEMHTPGDTSPALSCDDSPPPVQRLCAKDKACDSPEPCGRCFALAHLRDSAFLWKASEVARDGSNVTLGPTSLEQPLLWMMESSPSGYLTLRVCDTNLRLAFARRSQGHIVILADESRLAAEEDLRSELLAQSSSAVEFSLHEPQSGASLVLTPSSDVAGSDATQQDGWDLLAAVNSAGEALCSLTGMAKRSNHACRTSVGYFCSDYVKHFDGPAPCAVAGSFASCPEWSCDATGLTLLNSGTCASAGCQPITNAEECESASRLFGLVTDSDQVMSAASTQIPSACSAEMQEGSSAALWMNVVDSTAGSSSQTRALCKCGPCQTDRFYQWIVGEWGPCGTDCSDQRRKRNVVCGLFQTGAAFEEQTEVDPALCRQAGLTEPASSEPCSTAICFQSQDHTRCQGLPRRLEEQDVVAVTDAGGKLLDQSSRHCLELPPVLGEVASDTCRSACSKMGLCVGFTLYSSTNASAGLGMKCCFLRSIYRWQTDFHGTECHLAQGARTHSGCLCQVSWTRTASIDGVSACGPESGGCCTTPDSGAVPWCPTTSSSCGLPLDGEQRWDFCDVPGLPAATVTSGTCREHVNSLGQKCDHIYEAATCSQIATVLGLPDNIPEVVPAESAAYGCLWHSTTSQLWISKILKPLNLSSEDRLSLYEATWRVPEICFCPHELFRWEVDEWTPCFKDPLSTCGARKRTRQVYCVKGTTFGDKGQGEVVSGGGCLAQHGSPPSAEETCHSCTVEMMAAAVEYHSSTTEDPKQLALDATFMATVKDQLASVMRINAAALHLDVKACCLSSNLTNQEPCCLGSVLPLELRAPNDASLLEDASAGDALLRLSRLTRHPTTEDSWATQFKVWATGSYHWDVTGDWSDCAAVCQLVFQTRPVECVFLDFASGATFPAADESCDDGSKPEYKRSCGERPCKDCSGFTQSRQYHWWGAGAQMQHEAVVFVRCGEGFDTADTDNDVAQYTQSSCEDGSWTALDMSCGWNCPAQGPNLADAAGKYEVYGDGIKHGALRQVVCRSGLHASNFEAPPSVTSVCNDGEWSLPDLPCLGDCQDPAGIGRGMEITIVNAGDGSSTSPRTYAQEGETRRVSCAAGYSNGQGFPSTEAILQCEAGNWQVIDGLVPVCKADCPRYIIAFGFTVSQGDPAHYYYAGAEGILAATGSESTSQPLWMRSAANEAAEPGARHGSEISVRCATGYSQVPGSIQEVRCEDGRWTPLSLVCHKDCEPLDSSFLSVGGYILLETVFSDSIGGSNVYTSELASLAQHLHGSTVMLACAQNHDAIGAVECHDGEWVGPDLQCFSPCTARHLGSHYIAALVGTLQSTGEEVPHGAKMLVTCAEGHSPLNDTGKLLDVVECIDGEWTEKELQCLQDCAPLQVPPGYKVTGEGLQLNDARYVSCKEEPEVSLTLRCLAGAWYIIREQGITEDSLFTGDSVPLTCKGPPTGFAALTPAEKVLVWSLVVCSIVMVLVLAVTLLLLCPPYFLVRSEPLYLVDGDAIGGEHAMTSGELRELQRTSSSPFGDPTAGLRLAGMSSEYPGQGSGALSGSGPVIIGAASEEGVTPSSQPSGGFERLVSPSSAKSLTRSEGSKAASRQPCLFPKCRSEATHLCFPCNHLCLCREHAATLTQWARPGLKSACPACKQPVDCAIDCEPSPVFTRKRRGCLRFRRR